MADDFWAMVNKTKDCWLWTGPRFGPDGYGLYKKQSLLAHRAAHLLTYGEPFPLDRRGIPLPLLQTCKNKGCVNPDHLEFEEEVEIKVAGAGLAIQAPAKGTKGR